MAHFSACKGNFTYYYNFYFLKRPKKIYNNGLNPLFTLEKCNVKPLAPQTKPF